jgi:hypothetical protein
MRGGGRTAAAVIFIRTLARSRCVWELVVKRVYGSVNHFDRGKVHD